MLHTLNVLKSAASQLTVSIFFTYSSQSVNVILNSFLQATQNPSAKLVDCCYVVFSESNDFWIPPLLIAIYFLPRSPGKFLTGHPFAKAILQTFLKTTEFCDEKVNWVFFFFFSVGREKAKLFSVCEALLRVGYLLPANLGTSPTTLSFAHIGQPTLILLLKMC